MSSAATSLVGIVPIPSINSIITIWKVYMTKRDIHTLKELLALASFQLSQHIDKDEDIKFAMDNVESALKIVQSL